MFRTATPQHLRPMFARVFAMVVVAVSFIGCNQPAPTVSPSAVSPTPSSSASASPAGDVACTSENLSASGGPWGGAAGSRGADIVVTNSGSAQCVLPAHATVAIIDSAGTAVISTQPQAGTGPALSPGESAGFSLLVGNFCDETVNLPLHVSIALAAGSKDVTGLEMATNDDLPPCNGPGQPASISTTDWSPA